MLQKAKSWLTIPAFGDKDLDRNVTALNLIILSGIPIALLLALLLLFFTDLWIGPLIALVMVAVLLGLSHLLRQGRVQLVSSLLVWTTFVAASLTAVTSGGIRDTSMTIFYLQITLAGVFLSRRATIVYATAVIALFGALFWAEMAGWITTHYTRLPTIDSFAIAILTIVLTAVFVRLIVEQLVKHSKQVQQQTAVLQQKNDELAQLNQELVKQTQQRLRAEAVLHQKQKLESIGLLAGGVAHDFNNLLTGILGQVSLMQRKLEPAHRARHNAEKAIASAERARDLTQQLLAYAGKSNFIIGPLDLNQLIKENDGLLETSVQRQARLELDLAPELPLVEMDKGQLQQIVMNLAINAAEAIEDSDAPSKGLVTIRTRVSPPEMVNNEAMRTFSFMANDTSTKPYVCLEVGDNGLGMDHATIEQIFDPFYSTKAKGHGLGLSAVISIVRSQQGCIQVASTLGQGSLFRVFLPSTEEKLAAEPPVAPNAIFSQERSGLILVIDDETSVLEVVAEAFDLIGLQTLTASNGMKGIELFQQHCDQVNLVLLDLQMPHMDGEETLRHLREIRPDVQVLLSSGYSEVEMAKRPFYNQIAGFLQKPYDMNTLVQAIFSKLDETRVQV